MGSDRRAVSSCTVSRNVRGCSSEVAPASLSERTRLASIYIQDFVLVKKQLVRFGTGMNVISGQSGSGKSVLLNAFNVILGMQASSDMVRSPADIAGELEFVRVLLCNT
jgi:predicted ATPase